MPYLLPPKAPPQPSYVIALRDAAVRRPGKPYRPEWRIVSYRVGPDLSSENGATVRMALPVAERPFPTHPGVGSPGFLPRPGGDEFAVLFRDDRGWIRHIDLWSAPTLKRIACVRCDNAIRVDWLPERPRLSVIERRNTGFVTTLFSRRGKVEKRFARTLGAVSDLAAKADYAIRYSMPSDRIKTMVDSGNGEGAIARAIRNGSVSFHRFGPPNRSLTPREASRIFVGPGAGLTQLARIATPNRPIGFARNWAVVRAGVPASMPRSGLVYDRLGYPRARATFLRADSDDWDETHSVAADGTLLYSTGFAGEGYRIEGRTGDRLAAAIDPRGKRYWLIRGVGKTIRSVVLWRD